MNFILHLFSIALRVGATLLIPFVALKVAGYFNVEMVLALGYTTLLGIYIIISLFTMKISLSDVIADNEIEDGEAKAKANLTVALSYVLVPLFVWLTSYIIAACIM